VTEVFVTDTNQGRAVPKVIVSATSLFYLVLLSLQPMKQLFICFAVILIAVSSCTKSAPEEKPTKTEIKVDKFTVTLAGKAGATDTLFLQSNGGWTLTSFAAWLQVSSSSGNGNTKIIITAVETNTSPTARTATVTVSAKDNSISPIIITATQQAVTQQETIFTAFSSVLYGGSGEEAAYSVTTTLDGGYVFAGYARSSDGDLIGNKGGQDGWVVKVDDAGKKIWQRNFGGSARDELRSVVPTPDGGFLAAGFTSSTNDDAGGNHGLSDGWLVKVDDAGNKAWSKVYGGTDNDYFISITPTKDNGYIAVGYSSSDNVGTAAASNVAYTNIWVVKIDEQGAVVWSKMFGGSSLEYATAVTATPEGGYLVAGYTLSSGSGDVPSNWGREDALLIKLDAAGNKIWSYNYGGTSGDFIQAVTPATGGGYIVSGFTESTNRDVSGNQGLADGWLFQVDEKGNLLWSKLFGGTNRDALYSVCKALDGGYIATGFTLSNDGDISSNADNDGSLIVKVDNSGNKIWNKVFGGSGGDDAQAIITVQDDGYVIAGFTKSNNGDVSGNHGLWDAWLMALPK
jgi:hypothetical protein